ncbi:MAG: KamA family protein [Sphaerochaetaceae bacterium]|nr:KamA family protein [Sphaerochaetaceae bacterium]
MRAALLEENPTIRAFMLDETLSSEALLFALHTHYAARLAEEFPLGVGYYQKEDVSLETFYSLSWQAFALIRILDYIDHEGEEFIDWNLHGQTLVSRPIEMLRHFFRGETEGLTLDFAHDMLHLLRQLNGVDTQELPSRDTVLDWMERHPSGLDREILHLRERSRQRIIDLLVVDIDSAEKRSPRYSFDAEDTVKDKRKKVEQWWKEDTFHLRFAVRSSEQLLRYLDSQVDERQLAVMKEAEAKGIPIFATPYFLSLIVASPSSKYTMSDSVLRQYLFYTQDLVDEFGQINAWEKEDLVVPGEPNAAGWVLPNHNIHRRYPNVAIFIPDTMGRACGGLCAYCQRMYDFQRGRFNFNLDQLRPKKGWKEVLHESMVYFRTDEYLSDILITGGDAFMSSPTSLKTILDAVLTMAQQKIEDNAFRSDSEKVAEMKRIRLGTKIPIYLPQRITRALTDVLADTARKAKEIGISQTVVQTHFSSAMEVTEDTRDAITRILASGWAVTNQEVFTVSASRRGHSARLRQVLNSIGVLPYYTFTVKGFFENRPLFANTARSMQEQIEEKSIGRIDYRYYSQLSGLINEPQMMADSLKGIYEHDQIPFLSTDRNMLNLPGLGKSNTFRTIGITEDGRRILEFEFDNTRPHSTVTKDMKSVIIIESKSILQYLKDIEAIGEDRSEYCTIWGYSVGRTESRSLVFPPTY